MNFQILTYKLGNTLTQKRNSSPFHLQILKWPEGAQEWLHCPKKVTPQFFKIQVEQARSLFFEGVYYCHGLNLRYTYYFYLFQIYIPGTIDKEYPKKTGGYAFEFGEEAAAKRIISRVNPVFDVQFVTAFKKDSQELNDDDR